MEPYIDENGNLQYRQPSNNFSGIAGLYDQVYGNPYATEQVEQVEPFGKKLTVDEQFEQDTDDFNYSDNQFLKVLEGMNYGYATKEPGSPPMNPFDLQSQLGLNIAKLKAAGIDTTDQEAIDKLTEQELLDIINPPKGFKTDATQNYDFIKSSNEADVEDENEEKPKGLAAVIEKLRNFSPIGMMQNLFSNLNDGPNYQRYSPGTTIKNGIVNVAGVNTPYGAFGGDFFDPRTGLNRFDRARNRFGQTGKMSDLFASSRTLKDFLNKRKEIKSAQASAQSPGTDNPDGSGGYSGGFDTSTNNYNDPYSNDTE